MKDGRTTTIECRKTPDNGWLNLIRLDKLLAVRTRRLSNARKVWVWSKLRLKDIRSSSVTVWIHT
jgi:hypothetical protein